MFIIFGKNEQNFISVVCMVVFLLTIFVELIIVHAVFLRR